MGRHKRDKSGVRCCVLVAAVLSLIFYSERVEGRAGLALQSYRDPPPPPTFPSSFEVSALALIGINVSVIFCQKSEFTVLLACLLPSASRDQCLATAYSLCSTGCCLMLASGTGGLQLFVAIREKHPKGWLGVPCDLLEGC